ncbi:MAG: hypothetical protein AAFY15_12500 [Cyanobacteria bacterium J06648_11]
MSYVKRPSTSIPNSMPAIAPIAIHHPGNPLAIAGSVDSPGARPSLRDEATSLCVGVWQAPRLARPDAWMTDVPSVKTTGDRATVVRTGTAQTPTQKDVAASQREDRTPEESTEPAIAKGLPGWWIAMGAIAGILLGMLLLGRLT